MAKKKSASTKKAVPKKPVPPMYPKPAPINLGTGEVVCDGGAKKIVLTDIPSPEAVAFLSGDTEIRRTNLIDRLRKYSEFCFRLVKPYCGERPSGITEDQWRSIDQRMGAIRELPQIAPSEVHAALTAWRLLRLLVTDLDAEGEISDGIKRAICNAFDIGIFIQRCCAQIEHGENAALGQGNTLARDKANSTKTITAGERVATAKTEYLKRKAVGNKLSKTSILKSMANIVHYNFDKGQRVKVRTYGSYGQLVRDSKDW